MQPSAEKTARPAQLRSGNLTERSRSLYLDDTPHINTDADKELQDETSQRHLFHVTAAGNWACQSDLRKTKLTDCLRLNSTKGSFKIALHTRTDASVGVDVERYNHQEAPLRYSLFFFAAFIALPVNVCLCDQGKTFKTSHQLTLALPRKVYHF